MRQCPSDRLPEMVHFPLLWSETLISVSTWLYWGGSDAVWSLSYEKSLKGCCPKKLHSCTGISSCSVWLHARTCPDKLCLYSIFIPLLPPRQIKMLFWKWKHLDTVRAWSKEPLGVCSKVAAFPHVSKQPWGDYLELLLLNCWACCWWASWDSGNRYLGLCWWEAPAEAVVL